MLSDLPGRFPLICLACRAQQGNDWSLHTLEVARVLRAFDRGGDDVRDGILRCVNETCRHEYPILDGIAVVHPDPAGLLEREGAGLIDPDLDVEALAALVRDVPDGTPLNRQLELMSIYIDAHWADCATAAPGPPASADLIGRVAARAKEAPVERAIELGASVGRWTRELAAGAGAVASLDQSLGALRRARRLLAGEAFTYARRRVGRHYAPVQLQSPPAAAPVLFVCGDALDPPFAPGSFARVAALNIVDVVQDPGRLLSVVTSLCAPGGEVLLASPYEWQTGYVGEKNRIGDVDPAAAVVARLRGEGLTLLDEAEIPWTLRRDDRAHVVYRTHYLRALKS